MSDALLRCFVAVPIGDAVRAALVPEVDAWGRRDDLGRLRWIPPDAWHLTLAFLGGVQPADVPSISAVLERCAAFHTPFRVALNGVGGFPVAARARIAWCGISGGDSLERLAARVRSSFAGDLDAGRPFAPHLTLGRSRGGTVDMRAWVADASVPASGMVVERMDLLRSHLGAGPARYELLGSARLAVVVP